MAFTRFDRAARVDQRVLRLAAIAALAGSACAGCDTTASAPVAADTVNLQTAPASDETGFGFSDIAVAAHLNFVYHPDAAGLLRFFEIMGGGVALLDYDRDGDLDVYLVQGRDGQAGTMLSDQLFRNDLENGRLQFKNVTREAGISVTSYGMGVTAADFNNDGHTDLFVTGFESCHLLINDGLGHFHDRTATAGLDDHRWSTSAAAVDYDRDGWLDLYVCHYVNYDEGLRKPCFSASGAKDYCGPSGYDPVPDRLLRNRRDGTFEEVSMAAGIARTAGPGLGVVCADLNHDHWPDIYVANDAAANFCWINQKDGTFKDDALLNGTALNGVGRAEGGMGVDTADFDNDGDFDLMLGHLVGETNTLYVNEQDRGFADQTSVARLATPSLPSTTFGLAWIDFENDGDLDIIAANGAVKLDADERDPSRLFPAGDTNQAFRQTHHAAFEDATASLLNGKPGVSRGLAVGDLDNDGAEDAVIVNSGSAVEVLLNRSAKGRRWIGFQLLGSSGRDAIGAVVELKLKDGSILRRRVHSDGSYCSSSDPRIIVGLHQRAEIRDLTILWPDGQTQCCENPGRTPLVENQYNTVHRSADAGFRE